MSKWDDKYQKYYPVKAAEYPTAYCYDGSRYEACFFEQQSTWV